MDNPTEENAFLTLVVPVVTLGIVAIIVYKCRGKRYNLNLGSMIKLVKNS